MSLPKTLQEVYDVTKEQARGRVDVRVKAKHLSSDGYRLRHAPHMAPFRPARMTRRATAHLMGFARGPKNRELLPYGSKAVDWIHYDLAQAPDIQDANLNWALQRMAEANSGRTFLLRNFDYDQSPNLIDTYGYRRWDSDLRERGVDPFQTRAIASTRYGRVDNDRFMECIMRAFQRIGQGRDVRLGKWMTVTPDRFRLKVYVPEVAQLVTANGYRQPYAAGIYFQNGTVKNGSLACAFFVEGGACENSIIIMKDEEFSWKRNHTTRLPHETCFFVSTAVASAFNAAPAVFDALEKAAVEELPDPSELLDSLAKKLKMDAAESAALNILMQQQGGNTRLGLVNGLTAVAHSVQNMPQERSLELEIAGGNILMALPGNILAEAVKARAVVANLEREETN